MDESVASISAIGTVIQNVESVSSIISSAVQELNGLATKLAGFVTSKDASGLSLRFDLTETATQALKEFLGVRKAA